MTAFDASVLLVAILLILAAIFVSVRQLMKIAADYGTIVVSVLVLARIVIAVTPIFP